MFIRSIVVFKHSFLLVVKKRKPPCHHRLIKKREEERIVHKEILPLEQDFVET